MRTQKIIILFLVIVALLSCSKKNDNFHIDIVFFKYNVMKGVVSPDWNDFIDGRYPEYQARRSINNRVICDSIVSYVNNLKPLNIELEPQESYPFMQCTYLNSDNQKSVIILHIDYLTLNGQKMALDTNLVNILKRESGYNNPPTFERK